MGKIQNKRITIRQPTCINLRVTDIYIGCIDLLVLTIALMLGCVHSQTD